jgi:hypothetical protein
MTESKRNLPKRLVWGSWCIVAAGFVPFLLSISMLIAVFVGRANPDKSWLAGEPLPHSDSYTLNDIKKCNQDLAVDLFAAQHVQYANLFNTGVVAMALGYFGLRRYQRWAWYLLVFVVLWPATNDLIALLISGGTPTPFLPDTFGILGLVLSRGPLFSTPAIA